MLSLMYSNKHVVMNEIRTIPCNYEYMSTKTTLRKSAQRNNKQLQHLLPLEATNLKLGLWLLNPLPPFPFPLAGSFPFPEEPLTAEPLPEATGLSEMEISRDERLAVPFPIPMASE